MKVLSTVDSSEKSKSSNKSSFPKLVSVLMKKIKFGTRCFIASGMLNCTRRSSNSMVNLPARTSILVRAVFKNGLPKMMVVELVWECPPSMFRM